MSTTPFYVQQSYSLQHALTTLSSREARRNLLAQLTGKDDDEIRQLAEEQPRIKRVLNALSNHDGRINAEWKSAYACTEALKRENVLRNRYSDILPYDRTLYPPPSSSQSFVNASSISVPGSKRRWIAAQAPLPETIHDSLSLCLPSSSLDGSGDSPTPSIIVMLTACTESGRRKSARYWPDSIGGSCTFEQAVPSSSRDWVKGDAPPLSVKYLDSSDHRGWRTNALEISTEDGGSSGGSKSRRKTIHHVEYFGWRDHGVPQSAAEVFSLLKHLDSLRKGREDEPVLVHCSAGVGRTGSLITLATLIDMLSAQNTIQSGQNIWEPLQDAVQQSPLGPLPPPPASSSVEPTSHPRLLPSFLRRSPSPSAGHPVEERFDPIMSIIDHLREQRTTMVQTDGQVEWLYKAAREWWQLNGKK